MLMTPEEGLTKYCPLQLASKCVTTACPMWRWYGERSGGVVTEISPDRLPPEAGERVGYCGMGGRP